MSLRSFLLGMCCGAAITAAAALPWRHSVPPPAGATFALSVAKRPTIEKFEDTTPSHLPALPPDAMPRRFDGQVYYVVPIQGLAMR